MLISQCLPARTMASEGAASRKKARRRNDQQANAPAQVVQQESAEGATNACETGNEQTQLQGLEQHDGGLQADQPNVAAASSKGTWISSKKPYLSFPGRIVVASTAVEITEACSTFMGLVAALKNPSSKLILGFDMEWQYLPHEHPPALVQLCAIYKSDTNAGQGSQAGAKSDPGAQGNGYECVCYLLHLARLGPTGKDRAVPALKELLEHDRVLLATCGDRDESKLQEDLGIKPAHMEQVDMMHFLLQEERRGNSQGSHQMKTANRNGGSQQAYQLKSPIIAAFAPRAGAAASDAMAAAGRAGAQHSRRQAKRSRKVTPEHHDLTQIQTDKQQQQQQQPPQAVEQQMGDAQHRKHGQQNMIGKKRSLQEGQQQPQGAARQGAGDECDGTGSGDSEMEQGQGQGPAQGLGTSEQQQEQGAGGGAPRISLARLVGLYLGGRIDKAPRADGGVWEREQLRDRYIKYAATDAFAQLLLFHALRELLRAAMSGELR